MHFSKTYTQILLTLPPELRDNAIQYRQLKKLINKVVLELNSLGLDPSVLSALLAAEGSVSIAETPRISIHSDSTEGKNAEDGQAPSSYSKIVYELHNDQDRIEPRLRVWKQRSATFDSSAEAVESPSSEEEPEVVGQTQNSDQSRREDAHHDLLQQLRRMKLFQDSDAVQGAAIWEEADHTSSNPTDVEEIEFEDQELVIPLLSDSAFYQLLYDAIQSLETYMNSIHADFTTTLHRLSSDIAQTARPSPSEQAAGVVSHLIPAKSDLDTWRIIFSHYIDAEIFESVSERNRGERSIEDCEQRLQIFAGKVAAIHTDTGRKTFRLKQSRVALDAFMKANLMILYIKKFQFANAEATRKILKKHAKRTALPLLDSSSSSSYPAIDAASLTVATIPKPSTSMSRILVQAIGETLLPVVPHIDDYSCLICTNLAFKPIRLSCRHLFCVRCLVKMQKRGQDECPMCRMRNVHIANRSNVDWTMLQFMQQWFPKESRQKQKENEKEAADEELREMGIDPNQSCVVC
ncbi:SPX domain-containing protein [Pterulicium gracile]|uniref:SPX domain-containing protein n=1 Tax=Pterulicium gracile TaxID=1884261 RepID=A0A5C3QG67_9AGAR|nr:SPX domain-containing protein [Pterula gracilis]